MDYLDLKNVSIMDLYLNQRLRTAPGFRQLLGAMSPRMELAEASEGLAGSDVENVCKSLSQAKLFEHGMLTRNVASPHPRCQEERLRDLVTKKDGRDQTQRCGSHSYWAMTRKSDLESERFAA